MLHSCPLCRFPDPPTLWLGPGCSSAVAPCLLVLVNHPNPKALWLRLQDSHHLSARKRESERRGCQSKRKNSVIVFRPLIAKGHSALTKAPGLWGDGLLEPEQGDASLWWDAPSVRPCVVKAWMWFWWMMGAKKTRIEGGNGNVPTVQQENRAVMSCSVV